MQLPKLSLYVHIPWCVQKCPYCDFNSHGQKGELPESAYIAALLADLDSELQWVQQRPLHSIFIGGGTPSLLSGAAIHRLLEGIQKRIPFEDNIEITMEANPGTAEAARFRDYFQSGVNRLSLGIQSFDDAHLKRLGRIHDAAQAKQAVMMAKTAGFTRINLDLMHGLPNQTTAQALADIQQALELAPTHLSWYQLTIEPNTAFASRPPKLPDDESLWDIETHGKAQLADAGFQQYEISAYGCNGDQARHNLNYWRFGDYIGIGCGAHGKLTQPEQIIRRVKLRHPKGYLDPKREFLDQQWSIAAVERPFEYFLNRFRLYEPVPKQEFIDFTGQVLETPQLCGPMQRGIELGLVDDHSGYWQVTQRGHLFLNDLLDLFIVDTD
ncbi:radical SAM family heme chaperone HemW [Celerinatantimonas sp. YJH-8]|uniref:radical SAM family heme chaperone HemW n=1 Tax=Celerinatantimonas sp. YJH-8 TaxID=3228714 RepID=UPI0038CACF6F